jgi:hypothetical protein
MGYRLPEKGKTHPDSATPPSIGGLLARSGILMIFKQVEVSALVGGTRTGAT